MKKLGFLLLAICVTIKMALFGTLYLDPPADFNFKREAVGCFIEFEDKILILHRQDGEVHGNSWSIPGGKLKSGETPIEGAIRETFEETGFQLDPSTIQYLQKVYIRFPNLKADFVCHLVRVSCPDLPGNVHISFDEHKGFTWVTPKDALKVELMSTQDECIKLIYQD